MFIKISESRYINLLRVLSVVFKPDTILLTFGSDIIRVDRDDPELEKAGMKFETIKGKIEGFLEKSDSGNEGKGSPE